MNLKQLKKTFNKKKIFITGNTGFVGSYLSMTLSLINSNLLCFSLKKKNNNYLSNLQTYKKKIKTINDDLKNISRYKKTIKKFSPEIVIHLASQPIVKTSYKNTIGTYNTNILGTVNLLEVLKDINSVKQILIFTSDKVYKNQNNKRLNENSTLGWIVCIKAVINELRDLYKSKSTKDGSHSVKASNCDCSQEGCCVNHW